MKNHDNYVAQQSFIELCAILKEQEGLYYCEIAQQMNIEISIFNRWMHCYISLPESYNTLMANYFKNEVFARHKDLLVERMKSVLKLKQDSFALFLMKNMSYESLIWFLFCELKIEDICKENHIFEAVIEVVKNTIYRKMQSHNTTIRFCHLRQLIHELHMEDKNMEFEEDFEKSMFFIKICNMKRHDLNIAIYLISNENADTMTDYISIAQQILTLKQMIRVKQLLFLRMPELTSLNDQGDAMERYGDFASRKIIRIIENLSNSK